MTHDDLKCSIQSFVTRDWTVEMVLYHRDDDMFIDAELPYLGGWCTLPVLLENYDPV